MWAQSRPTRAAARPRSSAGPALNAALSRSTSKSQKKGNCIEWTLSCAGRDVCERQEVGLFSITGVFLPRLQSCAFNPALDRRTSKSDACDSPQLLFLKQTTWKQQGTSRTRRGSLLSRQNKDELKQQTLRDLRTNPGCASIRSLCLWRLQSCRTVALKTAHMYDPEPLREVFETVRFCSAGIWSGDPSGHSYRAPSLLSRSMQTFTKPLRLQRWTQQEEHRWCWWILSGAPAPTAPVNPTPLLTLLTSTTGMF